jgi:tetratricopeptide (TPR) repeat protein
MRGMFPSGRLGLSAVLVLALIAAPLVNAAPPQAGEHAQRGRELIGRGDLPAAERELRKAVQLAPQDPENLALLGAALGMQNKLQESDLYLEKALRLDPSDSATRRNLAWNQFVLGDLVPAKTNLNRVLKEKPHDNAAILLSGMIEEESKNYSAAVKLLESVPGEVRQHSESQAALARAYYYTGRREKARETLAAMPHNADADSIFLVAQVAAELRTFDIAESLFRSLWPSYPDAAKLGYSLARVLYREDKFSESVATLRHTIAVGHESSEIYNLLGWCLFKQDDLKGAVAALDKAIVLDPGDESNYLDVGMIMLEIQRYDGAMAAAERALQLAPDSYRAHRLKAQIQFKIGRFKDAEALYERAVELNPSDAGAITGLATAHLDIGKTQAAEDTLKKAIERLPREGVLYQAYGNMLLWGEGATNSQAEARAVELFKKAEALDPSLSEPHYQLGKLALRDNDTREALRELETAVKLDPKSAKNHYGLAQVYRKLGRSADAAREVQLFQSLKAKEGAVYPSGPSDKPEPQSR